MRIKPALFTKQYLLDNGPSSPYDIWKAYNKEKLKFGYRPVKYQSFWENCIYRLKKLGLIEPVGVEEQKSNVEAKKLYKIVEDKIDHPAWEHLKKYYVQYVINKNHSR